MYKKLVCLLLLLPGLGFAQQKSEKAFVMVVGRTLNPADSTLVKECFLDGLKAKAMQNIERATEYFQRVLSVDPANHAALYELGNLYHAQNLDEEAERCLREAVTVNPDNEWYWLLLADVYKQRKDYAQLASVFNELIQVNPKEEAYYYDRAKALLWLEKVNEAQQVYNEIEKRFGPSEELASERQRIYIKQGKITKVIAEIEKQIKAQPNNVRNYLQLAELYSNDKNKTKVLELLQKAKAIDPENSYVRLSLADYYRAIEKNEEAFIELKAVFADPALAVDSKVGIILSYFPHFSQPAARAEAEELSLIFTKTHPEEPKSFSVYGDVLFQQHKLIEAKAAYRQALKLNNQVYLIWEQLLQIEISVSDFEAASTDGEMALSLFPNRALLYFYTAIAYSQQQKHENAINYLKIAAGFETGDTEMLGQIYSSLGDAYNALKQFKESDQAYEQALRYNENNSYALNNYAYYLSLRGQNLEKAAQMSKRSNELEPGNASFQDTYAWVLFKQKNYQEARVWMEKAISNNESNEVQTEHYGDILFFLGETDMALKYWIKAKEFGSKSQKLERKINEKKYVE